MNPQFHVFFDVLGKQYTVCILLTVGKHSNVRVLDVCMLSGSTFLVNY